MTANTGLSPRAQGRPLLAPASETGSILRVSEAGRMILVQVLGPLDSENAPRILNRLSPLTGPSRRIVLDLRRTEFVDSAGIRALMSLQARAEAAEAELRLVTQPGGQVHKVLGMLRLESRFQIFNSMVDAWISRWSDPREARRRQRQAA